MAYIGRQPLHGDFKKLDTINVVNGQAAYTMNHGGVAFAPPSANALIVSVNGVIQEAGSAYSVNQSTITFSENLVTGDVIDFIIVLGNTGSAVVPSDGSVTTVKLGGSSVTNAKIDTMAASKLTGALPAIDGSALTGLTSGFVFPAEQALNGQSSVDFTGIPSGTNIIKFSLYRAKGSVTGYPAIQIGDSGGIETSGYSSQDQFAGFGGGTNYGGSSNTASSWGVTQWSSPSAILTFAGELFRMYGNVWFCQAAFLQNDASPNYFNNLRGMKELSGELTQIRFTRTAGTYNDANSSVRIGYQ